MVGKTLSHYKIVGEIGRGGMGVVYKAEDTKLKRTVALKLLPVSTLANEDDRARFFREAQAAAQLQHANIATVYAIEETSVDGQLDQPFIAMELIEGETLTERIAHGPMKLEEVVDLATQIARALEAAHEKNIVHRDVKSGNVMLTKKGQVKVLDFGLAKTSQSTKLTQLGSTLGTIAYMSPEQARGEEVDRRSDIWSLGVLIYEMIAGRMPFASAYEQAAVYSILNEDPEPLTAVRTGVPMGLEWIVSKLLAKDADHRYQNISDLLVDLKTVDLSAPGMSRISKPVVTAPSSTSQSVGISGGGFVKYFIGSAIGAGLVILAWMLLSAGSDSVSSQPTIRLTHSLETGRVPQSLDISRDGSKIALAFDEAVHIMDLTSAATYELSGTENTTTVEFSDDGEWLLLTKTASIDRIPVSGGSPITIISTQEGGPRANWGPGDWIVFEDIQNVFKYSESSGELMQLSHTEASEELEDVDWPSVLPGGKIVMGTLERAGEAPAQTRFWDLKTGDVLSTVNFPGYRVQYLATGHLMGVTRREGLVIVPFDIESLQITGPRVPVLSDTRENLLGITATGTLVYIEDSGFTPELVRSIPSLLQFPQFMQPLPIEAGFYSHVELSPDESKLLLIKRERMGGGRGAVWIYDFETRQVRPITSIATKNATEAVWTADGDSIVYITDRVPGGPHSIYVGAADGSADVQLVLGAGGRLGEIDLAPNGETLVFVSFTGQGRNRLRRLDRSDIDARVTIAGDDIPSSFQFPRISSDGKWVAYVRNDVVFVDALDGTGQAVNVSRGFAQHPRWSSDGRLYYQIAPGGSVQRYTIIPGDVFTLDGFDETAILGNRVPYFDIFDDGERAIVAEILDEFEESDSTTVERVPLHFVINWFEEIRE